MRRARLPLLCFALLVTGAFGCGEDPLPRLEVERAELLARTLPKAEFWAAVQRKGELVKQELAIEAEAPAAARRAELESGIAAAEAELAAARAQRARAEEALAAAREEETRARTLRAAREEQLRSFQARHAAGETP
jgi:hypothetical protein